MWTPRNRYDRHNKRARRKRKRLSGLSKVFYPQTADASDRQRIGHALCLVHTANQDDDKPQSTAPTSRVSPMRHSYEDKILPTMISFTDYPLQNDVSANYSGSRLHQSEEDDDSRMDLDEDGFDRPASRLTSPGEYLTSSAAYMRGHGTYVENEEVIASVAGTIERVNRLVTVRAIHSRYNPEVGDLVIGRITEVQPRRWKVDANSRQDAVLMLSSVNLPGGVQRRKLESDELQMRNFFEESDLLVAEVQAFFQDGSISLHTRSLKYGKLRNGQLVCIPPILVRRLKSHFLTLPCGVDVILGLNGYIWVSKHAKTSDQEGEEGFDAQAVYSNQNDSIDENTRIAISRVTNIISILASHFVPLSDVILLDAYEWVMNQEYQAKDLLQEEVGDALVATLSADIR